MEILISENKNDLRIFNSPKGLEIINEMHTLFYNNKLLHDDFEEKLKIYMKEKKDIIHKANEIYTEFNKNVEGYTKYDICMLGDLYKEIHGRKNYF